MSEDVGIAFALGVLLGVSVSLVISYISDLLSG